MAQIIPHAQRDITSIARLRPSRAGGQPSRQPSKAPDCTRWITAHSTHDHPEHCSRLIKASRGNRRGGQDSDSPLQDFRFAKGRVELRRGRHPEPCRQVHNGAPGQGHGGRSQQARDSNAEVPGERYGVRGAECREFQH